MMPPPRSCDQQRMEVEELGAADSQQAAGSTKGHSASQQASAEATAEAQQAAKELFLDMQKRKALKAARTKSGPPSASTRPHSREAKTQATLGAAGFHRRHA